MAMTGGMLGLAGSTGVADVASDGGSTTISIDQMPTHQHSVYVRRINTTPVSGGNTMIVCHSSNGGGTDNAMNYMNETGGGRTLFLLTPLFMVGDELLNLLGGEQ